MEWAPRAAAMERSASVNSRRTCSGVCRGGAEGSRARAAGHANENAHLAAAGVGGLRRNAARRQIPPQSARVSKAPDAALGSTKDVLEQRCRRGGQNLVPKRV